MAPISASTCCIKTIEVYTMVEVKIARLGTATVEVTLEDGANVAEALDAADIEVGTNEKVHVNGENASMSTVLRNGDKVFLAKDAKSA